MPTRDQGPYASRLELGRDPAHLPLQAAKGQRGKAGANDRRRVGVTRGVAPQRFPDR